MQLIKVIIISVFLTFRFNWNDYDENYEGFMYMDKFLKDFIHNLNSITPESIFLVIGLYLLFKFIDNHYDKRLLIRQRIISLVLASLVVVNYAFRIPLNEERSYLYLLIMTPENMTKTIFTLFSWYIIYNYAQKIIELILLNKIEIPKISRKICGFLENLVKTPLRASLTLFTLFIPILIIDYPGILVFDAQNQLFQYFDYIPLKNTHPILHTILFGKVVSLFTNKTLGIFMFVILQAIVLVSGLGYLINFAYKKVSLELAWFIIFTVSVIPTIPSMITEIEKDIISTGLIILLFIVMFQFLDEGAERERIHLVFLLVLSIGTLFFRNNMLPVFLLSMVIILIKYFCFKNIKDLKIVLVLIVSIFCYKSVMAGFESYLNIDPSPNRREALSIPFQQTARYAKFYDDEVTDDEKEVINKVLDYDHIRLHYSPVLSNNVKDTHNEEATNKEMFEYFKVWFAQFKKHPTAYIEATLAQNNDLFTVFKNNGYYGRYLGMMSGKYEELYRDLELEESETSEAIKDQKINIYRLIERIPVLNILSKPASYIIVTIFLLGISLKYQLRKSGTLLIIYFVTLLSIVAGPISGGYVRYIAVFMLLFYVIFISIFTELKEKKHAVIEE